MDNFPSLRTSRTTPLNGLAKPAHSKPTAVARPYGRANRIGSPPWSGGRSPSRAIHSFDFGNTPFTNTLHGRCGGAWGCLLIAAALVTFAPLVGIIVHYSRLTSTQTFTKTNLLTRQTSDSDESFANSGNSVNHDQEAKRSLTEVLACMLPFRLPENFRCQQVDWPRMRSDEIQRESSAYAWDNKQWQNLLHQWPSRPARSPQRDQIPDHPDGKPSIKTIPRGGAQSSRGSRKGSNPQDSSIYNLQLSASKPFIPQSKIALLTLSDLADIFRYSWGYNRPGFDNTLFVNSLHPETVDVINAMNGAIATIRGNDVKAALTHAPPREYRSEKELKSKLSTRGYGDVDALQFCAAMRIFAEWRLVRQVPDGYKAYAVGMRLGHKDVMQNLIKAEMSILRFLNKRRGVAHVGSQKVQTTEAALTPSKEMYVNDNAIIRAPTIRELLEEDIALHLHSRLPRLEENSAAMGLLWLQRHLLYQSRIFTNSISGKHSTAKEAVGAAYEEVFGSFHGRVIQKMCKYSLLLMPSADEIFKSMYPSHLLDKVKKGRTTYSANEMKDVIVSKPSTTKEEDIVARACRDSVRFFDSAKRMATCESLNKTKNPSGRLGNHFASSWAKLTNYVLSECNKLTTEVPFISHVERRSSPLNRSSHLPLSRGGGPGTKMSTTEASENNPTDQVKRFAFRDLRIFSEVVRPFLDDMAGVYDELNMDDPSKA